MTNKPDLASMRDLMPQPAAVTLSGGVTLHLRAVTLRDHAWMKETYGGADEVQRMFSELNIEAMIRLFFHLLDEQSKAKYPPKKVQETNEDGVTSTVTLGGYRRLSAEISANGEDMLAIIDGLNRAFGVSNPIAEEQNSGGNAKKKRNAPKLTGA